MIIDGNELVQFNLLKREIEKKLDSLKGKYFKATKEMYLHEDENKFLVGTIFKVDRITFGWEDIYIETDINGRDICYTLDFEHLDKVKFFDSKEEANNEKV